MSDFLGSTALAMPRIGIPEKLRALKLALSLVTLSASNSPPLLKGKSLMFSPTAAKLGSVVYPISARPWNTGTLPSPVLFIRLSAVASSLLKVSRASFGMVPT